MHRLFVALRPPPEIRRRILSVLGGVPGARWQADEQLHITLRFLGELDPHMADDVAAALAGVSHPPVTARLDGFGVFERADAVDTLWAGVQPADQLRLLAKKVDQAVRRAGVAAETRAYLPHLTVARFSRRSGADTTAFITENSGFSTPEFTLDHMVLFESHLGGEGAAYHAVERYPLTR